LKALALLAAALAAGCTIDARVATVSPDGGVKLFPTLRAGSALIDEATCAARLRPAPGEPRPANATANHTIPSPTQVMQLDPWDAAHGFNPRADALRLRVSGNFTGTTDEILQWAACKWGFDEDLVRAEAIHSSNWRQTVATDWIAPSSGDCPAGAATRDTNGQSECAQTYGLFQVLWKYHQSAWPMYRESSAYHVDLVFGLRRACFEGWDVSQADRATHGKDYVADDEWGCLGAHFSGQWYDDGADAYISSVQGQLAARLWTKPDFCASTPGCVLPR
jgi:autotransporter family porin